MSIPKLIKKYGSLDKVPPEVLELEGLVRYKGRVVSIETLSPNQLADALGIEELHEETDEAKLRHKVREAQEIVKNAFREPIGKYLNEKLRKDILEGIDLWVDDAYNTLMETFKTPDHLKISMIPQVQFVVRANDFLRTKRLNPTYATEVLEHSLEHLLEWHTMDDPPLTVAFFDRAEESYIREREENIKTEAWQNGDLISEFRQKYGDTNYCGGGPFVSWAFRKLVLKEEEPPEFWGRKLFELRKKLVSELGDSEAVREFADLVYSNECSYAGERVFNFREDLGRGTHGLEALCDSLPEAVEDFEGLRKTEAAAIAFIETQGFHIDGDYLSSSPQIRALLKSVYEAECGTVKEEPLEHYQFLDKFVKSQSKKLKIARLSNQDSGFRGLVEAYCQGNNSYVDSLEENVKVSTELRGLEVNTTTFYRGTEPKEFVVAGGKPIDKEELRREQLILYKQVVKTIFTSEIVHGTDRLEQKIADAFKGNEKFSVPAEKPISDYVEALEDDEMIRRVCNVTAEYIERKQNVKEVQQAAAAAHHLKSISKFMRGKHVDEAAGEEGNVYKIKVASKNPFTDVDIGNDGGCCIGIYDSGDFEIEDWTPERFISYLRRGGGKELEQVDENGCYMPFYLKDRATQFVEIYKGQDRVGMALLFAGKNEHNEPCLLVNSIELSDRLKQDGNRETVVGEAVNFIRQYAVASGFKHVLMGGHNYNPAREHSQEIAQFNVEKIHCWNESFYSDVLDRYGKNRGTWRLL